MTQLSRQLSRLEHHQNPKHHLFLADKKTSNSLAALGEAIDVESEVYCRRRSRNSWRMRAALGLACAQAATLGTQVVGRPRSRPRYAARPRH